jgi:formate transporter
MLTGVLLEDALSYTAIKKTSAPPDKVLFSGMLAGFWVGIGGIAAVSAAGGVPGEVRHSWLSLPKFLMGAFFAFGILDLSIRLHRR